MTRPTLPIVPDEPDQVLRLHRFRRDHVDVMIGGGSGWWQARIPEPNGERVITRYTLRELLDSLNYVIECRDRGVPVDLRHWRGTAGHADAMADEAVGEVAAVREHVVHDEQADADFEGV